MADNIEASPICRGKNLTWETVLLFYNNMPKNPMPKDQFNQYVERNINGWTQTHSQIARQLAFYYEDNNVCYPRFKKGTSLLELIAYMQNWACNYFVPNPYTPSLSGNKPVNIYLYLKDCIKNNNTNIDEALDSIFDVPLSSHDKVKVYLSNFSDILIDNHTMKMNDNTNLRNIHRQLTADLIHNKLDYYHYFDFIEETTTNIKEEFEYYLRYCVNSGRRQGAMYRYGDSAIASYMSYVKADVLFACNRGKWTCIKDSLFEITNLSEIDNLCQEALEDGDFIRFEEQRSQWGIKTLLMYNAFLHARQYFNHKEEDNSANSNFVWSGKLPLQHIIYGAPGSGKSYSINKRIGEHAGYDKESGKPNAKYDIPEGSLIRTTFHPDYDYSQFVGCYKPKECDTPSDADGSNQIIYEFEPQAFTNAYVKAYKEPNNPIYLVIEEINRGNCAQIFGDIFQLLDRDEFGVSEYGITPDADLFRYLEKNCPQGLVKGEMRLPANLSILATMNTSDQSLFPMDSAFKRRWDWEYIPIDYEDAKQFTVVSTIGNFNWGEFIESVNKIIFNVTESPDKQIGNRFVKIDESTKKISEDQFVNKVLYYLWSDVFKDRQDESENIFKTKEGDKFTFESLFIPDSADSKFNTKYLTAIFEKLDLKVEKIIISETIE